MNFSDSEKFILNLLCSSDSSSDDDEQLHTIFSILEEKLLFKRKQRTHNRNQQQQPKQQAKQQPKQQPKHQRKRKRPKIEIAESQSCKNEEKAENFELLESAVIKEYKEEEDVDAVLGEIPDEILVANIENWRNLPEEEFCKLFRMSRGCFERLLTMFEEFPKELKRMQHDNSETTRSKMLLVFLLYVGHRINMKSLSQKIKIYRNYYVAYVDFVLDFLLSLKENFVFFPRTEAGHRRNTTDFQNIAGLRNIIGCIDKVRFRLKSPYGNLQKTDEFYNFPADMVCDASGRFMSLDLDTVDSTLAKRCANTYCFLASLKYSLREWTITPCDEVDNSNSTGSDQEEATTELHADQQLFNAKFVATYAVLPRTILQLQKRFKQLICIDTNRLAFARRLLQGCILLHNLTMYFHDSWQDEELNDTTTTKDSMQPIVVDPLRKSDVTTELERFKCPKGLEKREHMIYETCIFDTNDVEQEIIVE